jgi:HD-GYP domain-containing protein (c-di-GMP phosphodiesterase class II)
MSQEGRDEKGKFTAKNAWQMVRENYNGGRPRIYNTPDELIETAMEYFEWADETQKGKYAEAHLRLHLKFYNRTSWKEYKDNPLFSNAIYIIESILEGDNEQKLMWAGSTQGAIFKLKNKHNWKDESTQNNINQSVNVDFGNTIQPPSEPSQDT